MSDLDVASDLDTTLDLDDGTGIVHLTASIADTVGITGSLSSLGSSLDLDVGLDLDSGVDLDGSPPLTHSLSVGFSETVGVTDSIGIRKALKSARTDTVGITAALSVSTTSGGGTHLTLTANLTDRVGVPNIIATNKTRVTFTNTVGVANTLTITALLFPTTTVKPSVVGTDLRSDSGSGGSQRKLSIRPVKVQASSSSAGAAHQLAQTAHAAPSDVTLFYPGLLKAGDVSPPISNLTSVHGLSISIPIAVASAVTITLQRNGTAFAAATITAGFKTGSSTFNLALLKTDLITFVITATGGASNCTVDILIGV